MDEFESSINEIIKERFKDARIKIDHYSWPEKSPYRMYEKDQCNELIKQKIEEYSKLPQTKELRHGLRILVTSVMRFDPDNLPEHPSWEDDREFEKEALDALFAIIKTDREITQENALKSAREARAKAGNSKDKKRKEIYDRIVFELTEACEREFNALKQEVLNS